MAFAIVGSGTYAGASDTSISPAKPTGVAEGDIMFALLMNGGTYDDPTSAPAGWTLIGKNGDSIHRRWLYYKVAGASEGETYTWTWAASTWLAGFIVAYRDGFDTADPIDTYSNTGYTTSNTTLRAASATVSATGSPLIFIGGAYYTAEIVRTPPTDYATDYTGGHTNPDEWVIFASRVWSGSGATGTVDGTLEVKISAKHAFLVALNPPAATPDLFLDGVWG